jgi:S-adenosylmethionine synthetase
LDILAEGASRVEAIGALQEAMFGYLATALDGENTEGLLPRPAPLSHRLRYRWEMLKESLRGLFDRRHAETTVPCRYEVKSGHLLDCR